MKNIKDNINLLSLDTCLSIISSPCYKNDAIKAKYENNAEVKFHEKQVLLKDEMKTFVKMHYDLKEDMMDFFLKYL